MLSAIKNIKKERLIAWILLIMYILTLAIIPEHAEALVSTPPFEELERVRISPGNKELIYHGVWRGQGGGSFKTWAFSEDGSTNYHNYIEFNTAFGRLDSIVRTLGGNYNFVLNKWFDTEQYRLIYEGKGYDLIYIRDLVHLCGGSIPSYNSNSKTYQISTSDPPTGAIYPFGDNSYIVGEPQRFNIAMTAYTHSSLYHGVEYELRVNNQLYDSGSSSTNRIDNTLKTITFDETGWHDIELIIKDGVWRETVVTHSVKINPPPIPPEADFRIFYDGDDVTDDSFWVDNIPFTVDLQDTTYQDGPLDIVSYKWEVREGSGSYRQFSTSKNPTYKVTDDVTHTFRLTVTNEAGLSDTAQHSIYPRNGSFLNPNPGWVNARLDIYLNPYTITLHPDDYMDNKGTSVSVTLDGSYSDAQRLPMEYSFKLNNEPWVDRGNNSRYTINNIVVRPSNMDSSGRVWFDGNLEARDRNGGWDTDNRSDYINFTVRNSAPNPNFTYTTQYSNHAYAEVPINITNTSTDLENDIIEGWWEFYKDGKKIGFAHYDVNGNIIEEDLPSEYFAESTELNYQGGNLVFKEEGNYKIRLTVKDKEYPQLYARNYNLVSFERTTERDIYVNYPPTPPVAIIDMPPAVYINEPIDIRCASTDINNDIVSRTWVKPPEGNGTLSGMGGTLKFAEEGQYPVKLTVRDRTDLSDSVTEYINVIPPIPIAKITAEGALKENRKVTLHARDSQCSILDPIQHARNEWSITPLEGQNPTSIKISDETNGNEERNVVFKETGKYLVTLKVHNNYTDNNQDDERIEVQYTEKVIEIVEDIPSIADFAVSGNSPNFVDNPTMAIIRLQDRSYSLDGDIPAFHHWRVWKANSEGIFDSDELYFQAETYPLLQALVQVDFEEGRIGKFKARLDIKEIFGQPTIEEFVSDADRRTSFIEKEFLVNWIPFIEFELPEWAYTDDTLTVESTIIKDEKPLETTVRWSLRRANPININQMIEVDIDEYAEYSLETDGSIIHSTSNVGTIRIKESGFYHVVATITDEIGQEFEHVHPIRIYPLPNAVIEDDAQYRWNGKFNFKQNRKFFLTGLNSTIHDYYDEGLHPIDHSKDYWEIIPLDGQNADYAIKIKADNGTAVVNDGDSDIFITSNTTLNKEMLFKQEGRYKIRYQVTNEHGKKSPFAEQIITIERDLEPVANLLVEGESPNFIDSPEKTKITLTDISKSIDLDILAEREWVLWRDTDDDGEFDEKIGPFIGEEVFEMEVPFQYNTKGYSKAIITVKEDFGQPTILEFINPEDYLTDTKEIFFYLNWIPYIEYEMKLKGDPLPKRNNIHGEAIKWAYTDDVIDIETLLKDERVGTLKVTWTLERAKENNPEELESVDIDHYTEKILDNDGGVIRFIESGFYRLTATVVDEVGKTSYYQDVIRIYPLPTGVLDDNPIFRWEGQEWQTKENRRFDINANLSYAEDYYTPMPSPIHPIDRDKDYWEIIPLDGQSVDSIKVRGVEDNAPSDKTKFVAKDTKLDVSMLFKEKGNYKLRYQATNTFGKKSPFIEQIITVTEDKAPESSFEVISPIYRDKDDGKRATAIAYQIKSSSPDEDIIQIERIRYRFDSNNDGNFNDETWSSPVPINYSTPSNIRAEFKLNHVGMYQIEFMVKEEFGQPTLNEFVSSADRRETYKYHVIEVDNIRPQVDFHVVPTNKVDIVFTIGEIDKSKINELEAKVNNYIKAKLESHNADYIDAHVQMIETSTISTDEQGAEAILGDWRSVEIPENFSGSFSNVSGGWAIANNQLYATSGYRPARGYINPSPEAYKTTDADISFIWGIRDDASSFSHGEAGFMFRIVDDRNYYVYIMDNHDACGNVRYNNREVLVKVTNGSRQIISTNTFPSFHRGQSHKIDIKLEGNNMKIYRDGDLRFDHTDTTNPHKEGSYGFYIWDQYGAYFSNIAVTSQFTVTLDEVLKEPNWRDDSTRFVINLTDVPLAELNPNSPKYPVVLARMLNDGLYFAQLGTSATRSQTLEFVKDIDNKGTFIYNTPSMDNALKELGDYILDVISKLAKPPTRYLLLNEEINYEIFYTDFEDDPEYANSENWMYEHNHNFFENSMGQVNYDSIWLTNSINKFDKVGHFQVTYRIKDNPVGSDNRFDNYRYWSELLNGKLNLYVHRKPIAEFKANITKTGDKFNISYVDTSYDLDHQSMKAGYYKQDENMKWKPATSSDGIYIQEGGIREKQWRWKEVGDAEWKVGQLTTGETTKDYLVSLRVRDIDGDNGYGAWSDETVVLITNNPLPPIAQFTISPVVLPLDQNLSIVDTSYDPNGDPIVEWRWVLTKTSGDKTGSWNYNYTNTFNQTSFNNAINSRIKAQGIGDYRLTLQVRDNTGAWGNELSTSEVYAQTFRVIPVNQSPIAEFNPVSAETWTFPRTVNEMTMNYRPSNAVFIEERVNWNENSRDPDGHPITRNWTLARYDVPNISQISGEPTNVYSFTTKTPFANNDNYYSFKSRNLPYGAYRITLAVTDHPPVPPYDVNDSKTDYLTKELYVIPEISMIAGFDHEGEEIIVGDTITLKAIASEHVTNVKAEIVDQNGVVVLSTNLTEYINDEWNWKKDVVIPEAITESGEITLRFIATTDYGGEGTVTRTVVREIKIDVIALKLFNFRLVDIVNHPHLTFPRDESMLPVYYKTGYNATFKIDAKGDPDTVIARIFEDGTLIKTVDMSKTSTSGTDTTWEGSYFSSAHTPDGTIITIELIAYKGSNEYNYNVKELWDGKLLIVDGTALSDARINRIQ